MTDTPKITPDLIDQPVADITPSPAPVVEPAPVVTAAAGPEPTDAQKTLDALHAEDTVEPVAPVQTRAQKFRANAMAKVDAAIAAQPYRGAPDFTDLRVVAGAIIDALVEENSDF